MRVAFIVDKQILACVEPFVSSIRQEFQGIAMFPVGDDYRKAVREIQERQHDFDFVFIFLRFGHLYEQEDLFGGIRLPVIMLEHDAWFNFVDRNPYYRMWSDYLSREKIDLIVVSGLSVHERLQAEGHRSFYLPKGAQSTYLQEQNSYSGFVCLYGVTAAGPGMYERREEVYNAIKPIGLWDKVGFKLGPNFLRLRQRLPGRKSSLPIHRIRFAFRDMPRVLSLYSASILCDIGMHEPMAKHFEVSALGLVPIRDDETKDELEKLGYKDEESMILYTSVDDLMEKLTYYAGHVDRLKPLQKKTREVARRNTWEVRAKKLREHLERLL
jgi:hypothetical protein